MIMAVLKNIRRYTAVLWECLYTIRRFYKYINIVVIIIINIICIVLEHSSSSLKVIIEQYIYCYNILFLPDCDVGSHTAGYD